MDNANTNPIRFTQTTLDTWRAFAGTETVATIKELADDSYRITYMRTPWANHRNPAKTTRTVRGDLDKAQSLILRRGW